MIAAQPARSPRPAPRFEAAVVVERVPPPLGVAEARSLLRALAARLGVEQESVAVIFSDDAAIRELNRRFLGRDRATDVLSFPAGEGRHLGDVMISSQTARRQARRRGHSAAREARILLIHAFLHLLGYDHETDEGEMDMLEATLRWELLPRAGARKR